MEAYGDLISLKAQISGLRAANTVQRLTFFGMSMDVQFLPYFAKVKLKHKTSMGIHGYAMDMPKNAKKCHELSKDVKVGYFFCLLHLIATAVICYVKILL